MFVDQVHISVQSGRGGNGCDSYYQRTDRKVVAHGGDGGHGGSVIFRADEHAAGLERFHPNQHFAAEPGGNGGSEKKRGRNGEDLILLVPPGTKIFDLNRKLLIRHLTQSGEEVVAVKGGPGGQGNLGGKPAMPGGPSEELEIELSRRLPADIFLVGLPNSGKSTLMNKLTRTHLKEESYPFSTRMPEIGVWKASDYEALTLCELPSLYEGSQEGRGLGADFLKHLEGAPYIFYMIDPLSEFSASPQEGYEILRGQLAEYSEDFLQIPHAVLVTKMDLPEAQTKMKKTKIKTKAPVFFISLTQGEGMKELTRHLKKILDNKTHARTA